jgi:glycosyltransferase involved in cell wall biosynthesis
MTPMSPRDRRVLVVSQDRLDGQVAGTSIRALELARELSKVVPVTVAAVGEPPSEVSGVPCVGYHPQDPSGLRRALDGAGVALTLPQWPPVMRALRQSGASLIFDLYVPQPLETIGGFPGARRTLRSTMTEFAIDRFVEALRLGDRFICASEKQRDLWLGAMLAERLIGLDRYDADPSLRSVIDVVPFGLPLEAAAPTGGGGPRDQIPGIAADDEVILWNGGLWPWFDASSAIRAVGLVAERRPGVRLVFMGAASQVPAQRATERARALARELGLLDRVVFFNDAWVPYEQRADWLLQADCALSMHEDHLETRFAFRTRLLDCFWARVPVVCTGGDELADVIESEGAGAIVGPGDVEAATSALNRVLDRGRSAYAPALERIAARYRWDVVAAPLVRYVRDEPPPGPPAHRARRPGHALRGGAYGLARVVLNRLGLRNWPRL